MPETTFQSAIPAARCIFKAGSLELFKLRHSTPCFTPTTQKKLKARGPPPGRSAASLAGKSSRSISLRRLGNLIAFEFHLYKSRGLVLWPLQRDPFSRRVSPVINSEESCLGGRIEKPRIVDVPQNLRKIRCKLESVRERKFITNFRRGCNAPGRPFCFKVSESGSLIILYLPGQYMYRYTYLFSY